MKEKVKNLKDEWVTDEYEMRVCERERDRETEKGRERDSKRQREVERDKKRQKDRQIEADGDRHR